ncbi:MAG: site-2 protease family protein [Thermoplasmatota archaeon]
MRERRVERMNRSGEDRPSEVFTGPQFTTPLGILFGKKPQEGVTDPAVRERAAQYVARIVGRKYTIREVRSDQAGVYITVDAFKGENEGDFEEIRREFKAMGMYPRLVKMDGNWVIVVYPFPKRGKSNIKVNAVLFFLTIFTTVWAGAILWMGRTSNVEALEVFTVLFSPEDLFFGGLSFALPLLLILGIHELGHYFTSRLYHVDTTLPYFLPIPPVISPFGTFGAVISMKENISNRKALVDIGAAGPIAGFIVALPVTVIGLVLTNVFPSDPISLVEGNMYITFNTPIIFNFLEYLIPISGDGSVFPTAIAGWIGLFVTAINLFPVGQLDGGHIIRGVLGDRSRFISYSMIALLFIMGFVTGFHTYILFALLIMFMGGGRHPPPLDDYSPIGKRQYVFAALSVIMLVLTFHPIPLETFVAEKSGLEVYPHHEEAFIRWDEPSLVSIDVDNLGSSERWVHMDILKDGVVIVPSQLNRTFDWDESAFSYYSQRSQYAYDLGSVHILSMGPIDREMEGDGTETFDLVFGGSRDFSLAGAPNITIRFDPEEGDVHEVGIDIIDRDMFLHMDRTRIRDEINGTIQGSLYLFQENSSGSYNLSIRYRHRSSTWNLRLITLDSTGEWSEAGEINIPLSIQSEWHNITGIEVRENLSGIGRIRFLLGFDNVDDEVIEGRSEGRLGFDMKVEGPGSKEELIPVNIIIRER